MGSTKTGLYSSQNLIWKFLLIGCLVTVTLALVLSPQIAKEILKKHNDYRRQESASNMYVLHWNVSLQERADSWAQKCVFKHERNRDLGENLYFDTDHDNDVFGRGMEEWHQEKTSWGYTSSSCSRACHFTQLVWGYTTTIGCSSNICPSLDMAGRSIKNALLFVCYYYPRGNFVGSFPYGKGRPCSECASGDTCSDGLCISSGPISKLAPDFVKNLAPQTPIISSRSSHSFQDFKSLIQQFSSETSQEGHHQRSHHRTEHHHAQQEHFQSQSVISSGSESHSYSARHSRVQQHHEQIYQSSHGQTYHQQRPYGERNDWLKEPERIQQQQEEKRRQDLKELDNQKRLEDYHSNQRYHQQQIERNNWLKEKGRLQQQEEDKRRQDVKEQENKKRVELEKRQQELIEEKKKQAELEQKRHHLLLQQRLREEQLQTERLGNEENEERQRLLQYREIHLRQMESENLRKVNAERNKYPEEQEIDKYRRRQSTDDNLNQAAVSRKEPKDDRRSETVKISLKPPAETHSASDPLYSGNLRRHSYTNEDQAKTTSGLNLHNKHNQDNRQLIEDRIANQFNYSTYEESYRWGGIRNQAGYPNHVDETLRHQSTTTDRVIKWLPVDQMVKVSRGQTSERDYELVSKSNRPDSRRRNRTTPQRRDRIHGSSQTEVNSRGNLNYEDKSADKIHGEDSDRETNVYIDEKESEVKSDSLQKRRQREENSRGHLKKKRSKKVKKSEETHPHKKSYVMDRNRRRCVDRHIGCIQWTAKCSKNSAVMLACPMTCGKCDIHVNPKQDQDLELQTASAKLSQNGDPDHAQGTKRRNNLEMQKLTPAENRARGHQVRLEQDKAAQQAPMSLRDAEEIDQNKRPRRTKEERKLRTEQMEQRERERNQSEQAQEQQSVCRDDPKHIGSCVYWQKRGHCLKNKVINEVYCKESCGGC